jgi:hypothetical protein
VWLVISVSHLVYLVGFTDIGVLGSSDCGQWWSFATWAVLARV